MSEENAFVRGFNRGLHRGIIEGKKVVIDEFLEDLNNVSYVDLKTHKDDFPEFYIKVFDICQLREKWEAKKNE